MRNGRRVGSLALAALLVAGLTACGGDDSDDEASDTTEASSDESSNDDSSDESSDDTEIDLGDLSGECGVLAEAAIAAGAAFSASGEDGDLGDVAEGLERFADAAPDEIKDDVRVLAEAFTEYAAALADLDLTDAESASSPEVQAAIAAALEAFSDPAVQQASANVEAYQEENCG